MRRVLAIDIGGTKLSAGVVTADGRIVERVDGATGGTDADDLFATLAELVAGLDTSECDTCGVGCGGPMTRDGRVSPLNIPQWRAFPLRERLLALTQLPTVLDNDAKALALGEGWLGAARGESSYVGMVVSTGVGGGIVLDGRLLHGVEGNAGHIGHIIVEPDGHECGCGARGCVEAEASGTAITRITGRPPADADAATRRRVGTLVGRAIASVANLLDLRLAVVAGSVALGYGDDFFATAQAEIDARCRLDFSIGTRVVPAGLGADGPLTGAARLGLLLA